MISRRTLLAGGVASGALLAAARGARAIGEGSKFRIGQLALRDGSWNPRPAALRRIGLEIDKRTSIDVELDAAPVTLGSDRLHETPFLYLAGDRAFAVPPEADVERLRRFLTFGGFLFVDSAEARPDGGFDRAVRKLVDAVFPPPGQGLAIIPADHVLYKSFYLIEHPVGRVATSPVMEGVTRDDRLVVVVSHNDLGGAWTRDSFGNYEFRCEPGGERQRELAFRLGVNVAMYALCLDYKSDQVHVPFIMRRRRWRIEGGPPPDQD
jgi:hypothetical protein